MITFQQASGRWRSLAAALARVAAVILVLVTMALAARRLPGEEFGFWVICFAVMNFGLALDLGLRYGLGNRMAALTARAHSDREQRETFWAVFHVECLVGLVGFMFCVGVLPWLDWGGLFKIQSPALARQVQWLFPVVCGLVMLNQPLTVAATVFFARQEIIFVSLLSIIQSGVLMVVFGLVLQAGNFPVLVMSFFGVYGVCGLGMTLVLMGRCGWRWQWTPWREQGAVLRSFLKPSLEFFVLSLSAMTAGVVGPVIAGAAGGLVVAGDFSLIQRIFGFLATFHLALLAPLGPAYTVHARLGEWEWVRKKLQVCMRRLWPLLFVAGGMVVWAGHPLVLRVWTGRWIRDYELAGLFALGIILTGAANTYSVLLNSLGIVRCQATLSLLMLIPLIGLPIVFGRYMGIHGVALASVLCVLPGALLGMAWARTALERRQVHV